MNFLAFHSIEIQIKDQDQLCTLDHLVASLDLAEVELLLGLVLLADNVAGLQQIAAPVPGVAQQGRLLALLPLQPQPLLGVNSIESGHVLGHF